LMRSRAGFHFGLRSLAGMLDSRHEGSFMT
jgi:hypothetical protein